MLEETTCPECGGRMTSRRNHKTGQRFWGCNDYPECKGTRNTDGEAPRQDYQRQQQGADADLPSNRQHHNDRGRWRTE